MGKGTPQTFHTLGDIDVNQTLYDVALVSYRQAVKSTFGDRLDETQRKAILRLEARIAPASGGDSGSAVGVLEEIVALDPLDGDALMLLAQHYGKSGDPDRALFCCERAQELKPRDEVAKYLEQVERLARARPQS